MVALCVCVFVCVDVLKKLNDHLLFIFPLRIFISSVETWSGSSAKDYTHVKMKRLPLVEMKRIPLMETKRLPLMKMKGENNHQRKDPC